MSTPVRQSTRMLTHNTARRARADFLLLAAVSCLALCVATTTWAQGAPAIVDPVPAYDTFTVISRVLGERRRINVHVPRGYRASSSVRYPVVYMPDGGLDEDFPHIVNTLDSLMALRRIRPVIVVGIPNTERRRDLTGFTRVASDSAIAPHVGGSAAFRRFVREELIAAVGVRYRITNERSIVGESLAGLFVVETFFAEPKMFRHYVALDPSIWWNKAFLADSAPTRLRRLNAKSQTLYLASSREDIGNGTARVADALRARTPRGMTWHYAPRPDLTHATIFRGEGPTALAWTLR